MYVKIWMYTPKKNRKIWSNFLCLVQAMLLECGFFLIFYPPFEGYTKSLHKCLFSMMFGQDQNIRFSFIYLSLITIFFNKWKTSSFGWLGGSEQINCTCIGFCIIPTSNRSNRIKLPKLIYINTYNNNFWAYIQ